MVGNTEAMTWEIWVAIAWIAAIPVATYWLGYYVGSLNERNKANGRP